MSAGVTTVAAVLGLLSATGALSLFGAAPETAPDAPLPGEETTALWRPELWVA